MAPMVWDKGTKFGHAELDEHHDELFDLINELNEAGTTPHAGQWELLVLIRDYAEFHFRWEEDLMMRIQFPGAQDLKAAHDHKMRALEHLVSGFRASASGAFGDWMDQLRNWFTGQFAEEDPAFVHCLRSQQD